MKKLILLSTLTSSLLFGAAEVLPVEKRSFTQSQYMPDISLILDASFVNRNKTDTEVSHLEIPGIAHGLIGSHAHGEHAHATYNANNGFNINYAELVMSSSVDPYFTMDGVFHFSEHGVAIEEAYFTTTSLPQGLRLRAGKFNSNFGRINEQHHHYWDFGEMPLVYDAFLGMHGINEIGVQLQYLAPFSEYLMLGVEVLQGENAQTFGIGAIGDNEDPLIDAADAPGLFVGYIKTAYDIGDTTIMPGISYARGSSRIDHSEDEENPHAFSGMTSLYGADLTVKHYYDSYSFLSWQSEWMMRKMDGRTYAIGTDKSAQTQKNQSGFYSQLVYGMNKNWRMGARYDLIYQNDVEKNSVTVDLPNDFNRYSAMIEYHPSEFSRFRLQYNNNNALYNEEGEQQHVNTLMLQANISIGAHGAHAF
ncbi:MAG: hypothetical protein U9R50_11185 [Campylobacterota bacterium]|nr:hypothetical protein [Campylobacterota bacterium]